jgi:integrase
MKPLREIVVGFFLARMEALPLFRFCIGSVVVGTGKPYTAIMKVWSRLRAKAGLPHLRIHDLRHQYASFLVNAGRSLYEVQQILGHNDPSVTQRYAHLSTKSLQDAANSASIMIRRTVPVAIPVELPLLVDMAISEPVEMAVAA